ncbi:hypothetical protein [Jeotgalibacillus haloalkalitolerans]|uniref:Flagellin Flp1-like domain-containing protein n=1 Tax=Jeotgalibacillus haloalkalitolerans TaxID=3104292 RepID=A0ABU5KR12_9BACL|nr:hypothetical protein [Jeotgalibacillus sp. HH7-29]MDZ5713682.1 hypothetical protein [Jeotgalibacillus sp. HH7-29]
MKMLNEWTLKLLMVVAAPVKNERGSQTLEWLGIAAVVVIVVGVISQAFYGETAVGDAVSGKFIEFIKSIGS